MVGGASGILRCLPPACCLLLPPPLCAEARRFVAAARRLAAWRRWRASHYLHGSVTRCAHPRTCLFAPAACSLVLGRGGGICA
jgi:hypothetical protein